MTAYRDNDRSMYRPDGRPNVTDRAVDQAAANINAARQPAPYSVYPKTSNFVPFQQVQNATPTQQPAPQAQFQQPSTYQAGQGVNAAMDFQYEVQKGFLGWLAFRAGRNFYATHPDKVAAVEHGAHALRRWTVWLFFVKCWIVSAAIIGWCFYLKLHDIRGESFPDNGGLSIVLTKGLIFIGPALLALLITYCRNVDFSLFKRTIVYHVLRPVCLLTNWIPNWLLYLTIPCILMFPFPMMPH